MWLSLSGAQETAYSGMSTNSNGASRLRNVQDRSCGGRTLYIGALIRSTGALLSPAPARSCGMLIRSNGAAILFTGATLGAGLEP